MAGGVPPEVLPLIPWRPGEQILGFLPNLFSMVIGIQGGRGVRMDEIRYEMVERPTNLIVTDQRMIGYGFDEVEKGLFGKERQFRPRFGADLEKIQEVKVKDNRMELMVELSGMGLSTLYLLTGSTREAQGLAQWTESMRQRRLEALGKVPGGPGGAPAQHERRPGGGWNAPPPAPPR
ncbi:MAG: hypothetical protein KGJ23_02955 [Euryarchaeota archaeon]|nr:hypothetical protein [Euryarchaeota archaeon]MDE1835558.1 hypothetical protein [Euryarchaeota archaeon]MDE1879649.1 hypothetical protein [Euryarchaeota archaeon]MDE2043820.1 hypothetical protein [Thermoplasmata archaeon]